MLLPQDPHYDRATIAVSARLEGEVAGHYPLLGCRRQDAAVQIGYRLAVAPDAGRCTLVRRDDDLEVTRR